MQRVRFWCVAFFAWCFILCNTERMFAPINLASFVYVAAAVLSVALVALPLLQRISLPWAVLVPLPAIVAIKAWRGYEIGGTHLTITVTELCAIAVTIIIARQFGRVLTEFHTAVRSIMVGYLHDRSVPFKSGQADIYREIRRSRIHHRPLTLLAVAPDGAHQQVSLDGFLREVERETIQHYTTARIADFLSSEMNDCDIITQRGGHFVLLLPETDRSQVSQIVERLEQSARQRLGFDLRVGASFFPEQGSTFVTLLETAEDALRGCDADQAESNGAALAKDRTRSGHANGHAGNGHANNGHAGNGKSANGHSGNGHANPLDAAPADDAR